MLGNLLHEQRIELQEREITVLSRFGKRCSDTVARSDIFFFGKQPEKLLHFRNGIEHHISRVVRKNEHVRILQGVDVLRRRGSAQETVQVCDPPIADGKLNDVLFAFVVDAVFSKATAVDECEMSAYLPPLQEKLIFPDPSRREKLTAAIEFPAGESDSCFDMGAQYVEHDLPPVIPCECRLRFGLRRPLMYTARPHYSSYCIVAVVFRVIQFTIPCSVIAALYFFLIQIFIEVEFFT